MANFINSLRTWRRTYVRPRALVQKLLSPAIPLLATQARLKKYKNTGQAPRILILANGGIGNAIEGTPLVQALRVLWPKAFLVLLGPKGDLFSDWCVVDHNVQNLEEAQALGPFEKTFMIYGADLRQVPTSDLGLFGELYAPRQNSTQPFLKPEREVYLDLAKYMGYRGQAPPLYVSLRRPSFQIPAGDPLVCLLPGSKPEHLWRHKRWAHYGELSKLLLQRFPQLSILILGTGHDPVDESLLKMEGIFDLRGKCSLAETGWILKQADLVIGNDCGPMHIADAVLAEHLVLFGPTCELKNGPRNRGLPIRVPVHCSPCQFDPVLLNTCPKAVCMEGITPELVLSHAEKILTARRSKQNV